MNITETHAGVGAKRPIPIQAVPSRSAFDFAHRRLGFGGLAIIAARTGDASVGLAAVSRAAADLRAPPMTKMGLAGDCGVEAFRRYGGSDLHRADAAG